MRDQIICTSEIDKIIALAKECIATCAIGVVIGANGVGKTTALKFLERRYETLKLPRKCLFHRCCVTSGCTSGVKDLLISLGRRDLIFRCGISLPVLIRQAVTVIQKKNLGMILLDEADVLSKEALLGLITLQDVSCESNHPLVFILGGIRPHPLWIGTMSSGISRTLRIENFNHLNLENTLAVLSKWGKPFRDFIAKIEKGEVEAIRLAQLIHKNTAGNFRRLRFFTELFLMQETKVDKESVDRTFSRLYYENPDQKKYSA
ncbi:MAG: AAA family ATPase [Verrucomicrobiota bacterium]